MGQGQSGYDIDNDQKNISSLAFKSFDREPDTFSSPLPTTSTSTLSSRSKGGLWRSTKSTKLKSPLHPLDSGSSSAASSPPRNSLTINQPHSLQRTLSTPSPTNISSFSISSCSSSTASVPIMRENTNKTTASSSTSSLIAPNSPSASPRQQRNNSTQFGNASSPRTTRGASPSPTIRRANTSPININGNGSTVAAAAVAAVTAMSSGSFKPIPIECSSSSTSSTNTITTFENIGNSNNKHQLLTPAPPLRRSTSHRGDMSIPRSPSIQNRSPSLSSSAPRTPFAQNYTMLGGRRFHNVPHTPYMLPNDEEESDRLTQEHFTIRFALQGNYLAPVSDMLRNGGRVLDVGCGLGTWTIEIAMEYPSTQVTGIDISPIYPTDVKPRNCHFKDHNILRFPWPFDSDSFDFIFQRNLMLGIPEESWPLVLSECVRVLKPGGYLELAEWDAQWFRIGSNTKTWNEKFIHCIRARGLDPSAAHQLPQLLLKSGLVNVRKTFVSFPSGNWAGKVGHLTKQVWNYTMLSLRPVLLHAMGTGSEEYQEMIKGTMEEVETYQSYSNMHFAYAQKEPKPDDRYGPGV